MAKAVKRKAESKDPRMVEVKKARVVVAQKSIGHNAVDSEYGNSEIDDDSGRLEIQQFLANSKAIAKQKATKRRDIYAAKFQAQVEERKKFMMDLLEQRTKTIREKCATDRHVLESLLQNSFENSVLNSLQAFDGRIYEANSLISPSLQQTINTVLSHSKNLITTYDAASREVASNEERLLVGHEWENDCQRLQDVLRVGKRATVGQVRHLLFDSNNPSGAAQFGEASPSDDATARETFGRVGVDRAPATSKLEGGSWAFVAKETVKGIQRATSHLPMNPF